MSEEDIARLTKFMSNIREDMDLLATNMDVIVPRQRELHDLVMQAWQEVLPRFEEASLYMVGEGRSEELQRQLRDHGLTGTQLILKLSVYEARRAQFHRQWEQLKRKAREDRGRNRSVFARPSNYMKRITARYLDIADRILDSLGFIPGTEAIKEVKGVMANLLFWQ